MNTIIDRIESAMAKAASAIRKGEDIAVNTLIIRYGADAIAEMYLYDYSVDGILEWVELKGHQALRINTDGYFAASTLYRAIRYDEARRWDTGRCA